MRSARPLSSPPAPKALVVGLVLGLILGLILSLIAAPARAQSEAGRLDEVERKLEQALKQVQALSKRVRELEAGNASKKSEAAAEPGAADKLAALEQQLAALANRPEDDRGLTVHGFADVGLAHASKGQPSGANISSVDFYLTPKFGDRVRSLIELNFEVGNDGDVGIDLERLQIGYTFSDYFTAWIGRFHTPYGYWNTAFHHGAQLQTSIRRPLFLDFEDAGGIVPAHTVGLWGTGSVKTAFGRLKYDLYAGNSPTIDLSDPATPGTGTLNPGLQGAVNRSATIGGNLAYAFRGSLDGLTLGLHALTSNVADTQVAPNQTRLQMTGTWFTYLEHSWEVLSEYYRFNNRDLSGGTGRHSSRAAYVQAGRSLGAYTPYARFEKTSLNQEDNYFAQQESGRSYRRHLAGVRYDLNPTTALKLELNRTRLADRATGSYSEVRSQVAIRF